MKNRRKLPKNRGFSLLEVMFACFILTAALLGLMLMIFVGVGRNGTNRMDTTATNVAQTVLEDIAAEPATSNTPVTIADCKGNNLAVSTAQGGSPVTAAGDIDFSQAPIGGYQAYYMMCAPGGYAAGYDVRWRIDPVAGAGTWAKEVTVAARQTTNRKTANAMFVPPVTLRTVVSQ